MLNSKISTVAIITKDRPRALRTSLDDLALVLRKTSHPVDILVVDSSQDIAKGASNVRIIDESKTQDFSGASKIRRCGTTQVANLTSLIAGINGIGDRLASFMLQGASGGVVCTGASRNVQLLLTLNAATLSLDDDIMPCPWHRRSPRRPTTHGTCHHFQRTFHSSRAEMFDQLTAIEDTSVIHLHEEVLGRRITTEKNADSLLDGATRSGRVIATVSGVAGSPTNDNPVPAILEALADGRRPESSAEWDSWIATSEHARICDEGLIAQGLLTSGYCLALLNDLRLPPWMPLWRSQDTVFATCLSRFREDAFVGYLPSAVIHNRQERHPSDLHVIVKRNARVTAGELLAALVRVITVSKHSVASKSGWGSLGSSLVDLCSSRKSLEDTLEAVATSILQGRKQRLDIASSFALPEFVSQSIKALDSEVSAALHSKSRIGLQDIGEDRRSSVDAFRKALKMYGEALQCWDDLCLSLSESSFPSIWDRIDQP